MLRNRYVLGGGIIAILLLANIISYILSNWGLITVKVTDAPLGQVIKSIERQGWVTICTDMPLDTKVTMWVDHVPLPEAMESLTADVGGQWHLGFFAAPTSAAVKQEIIAFQTGSVGDDIKTYNYPTPLAMLSSSNDDDGLPASNPYLQTWPGYHAPPPAPVQTADNSANNADGQAPDPPPAPPAPPTTLQDYLQAVAQEADVWIMTPGSWAPNVPAPPANISISRAVKDLVSDAHGSVQQVIVLRGRQRRGQGGGQRGNFAGGDTGWAYMQDRIQNAINGLPAEARPEATAQLQQEVKFRQDLQAAPPDQRMAMMRNHFMNRMGQNNWRRSPAKRAQMYQRAVSNRQAARGQ
jgi:hypothetical protein